MLDVGTWGQSGEIPTLELLWRRAAQLTDNARTLMGEMLCAWHGFHCDQPAEGTCQHPLLGAVAVCRHCASSDGLDVTPWPAMPLATIS
jgi:hypothetical protein